MLVIDLKKSIAVALACDYRERLAALDGEGQNKYLRQDQSGITDQQVNGSTVVWM